jgi:CO/xanthine dehydrogenase FAD-binding subunit
VKQFEYAAPASLPDAARLFTSTPGALLLAGGTDLLVQLRAGRKSSELVIDIKRIPELNEIRYEASQGLTIGAAVPCYRIYGDATVENAYPALADVAALIGGTQIQGRASLGGNLCNAAPSADAVPLLIALRATCRILGPAGEREIPVENFCSAPGRNVLALGELLISLHIPRVETRSGAQYLRFIPRNEMDIAVVGSGAAVTLDNGVFRSARIALSSVAPTPLFVQEAGDWLSGKPVNADSINTAAEMAKAAAKPITDMRGPAEYRKHLCAVLTRRALESAVRQAREVQ